MQKKKGISLIVMVITIVIMVILATAVILTLGNTGIIQKSNEAVDKTNEKTAQEVASMAWTDAYSNGEREVDKLKEAVEKELDNNKINKDDYIINVTITGVTVTKKESNKEVWVQKENRTVVKGDTVLNIGDDISYDETNGGTVTVEKDVDWKVLGAENGELLIMSASNIKDDYTLGGQDGYEKGISYLNKECEIYGKGAYALGARSITIEDIDKITGYDKTIYNKGMMGEYGNTVTYLYNGTNKPAYTTTNKRSGNVTVAHSKGFQWYDENGVYHKISVTDLKNEENNGKEIAKIKSTSYTYEIDQETDAYNMLVGENKYWLASSFSYTEVTGNFFGMKQVSGVRIHNFQLVYSKGDFKSGSAGVRAVVRLSPEYTPN